MKLLAVLIALLTFVGVGCATEWKYDEGTSFSDSTNVDAGSDLGGMWTVTDTPHTIQIGGQDQFTVDKFELNPSFVVPDTNNGIVKLQGIEQGSLTAGVKDIDVVAATDPAGNPLTVTRREGYATMDSSYDSIWSAAGNAANDITTVNPGFSSDIKVSFPDSFSPAALGHFLQAEETNTIAGESSIAQDAGDLKGGLFQAGSTGWVDATTEAGNLKSITGGSGISAKIYSWGDFNTNTPNPTLENKITTMDQKLNIYSFLDQ